MASYVLWMHVNGVRFSDSRPTETGAVAAYALGECEAASSILAFPTKKGVPMKIVTPGKTKAQLALEHPQWYTTMVLRCDYCGCEFFLEEVDMKTMDNPHGTFTLLQTRTPNGLRRLTGYCPNCDGIVLWEKTGAL